MDSGQQACRKDEVGNRRHQPSYSLQTYELGRNTLPLPVPDLSSSRTCSGIQLLILIRRIDSGQQECRNDSGKHARMTRWCTPKTPFVLANMVSIVLVLTAKRRLSSQTKRHLSLTQRLRSTNEVSSQFLQLSIIFLLN